MAVNNKQSYLEKQGIDARREQTIRSDYNKTDFYSEEHQDALSNPADPNKILGKGVTGGSMYHYTPNHDLSSTSYHYDSLSTTEGGGAYDIHGRNNDGGRHRLMSYNVYGADNAYGLDSIDESANLEEGQYQVK
jgi:hypothetical protein